jgi:aldehyde:ferredoxin oxidoreductase|tara:strand:+ start:2947 stop:4689 length:1743 start_codon:yes stop_codon:yes gene_type:complete
LTKIFRVNMADQSVTEEEAPSKWALLGGRGFTSRVIMDEITPGCHPLGPNNKLVMAPGIVTGSAAATSGRVSVGAKSPLTGGTKESNAGTPVSQMLGRLRIKGVIFENQPANGGWWLLQIGKDGAELLPADDLAGKSTSEVNETLFERYGNRIGVVCIGSTGENLMSMAGVCFNDTEGRASRFAARGGLGAVMGSKGLKAIVVDATGAPGVEVKNRDVFRAGERKMLSALQTHDVTKPGGALNTLGTEVLINVMNEAGGLPTRNFRSGSFEDANNLSGETLADIIRERGGMGKSTHACSPGCVIECSNIYPRADGSEFVSVMEYESVWALGANLGVNDMDEVAEMIRLCNEFGLDTIEAGVTLGVAMEAGIAQFGDGPAAIALLYDIDEATPTGRILGNGATFTGKAFGVTRVPTVKGQGMPAYEPRVVKGLGVTYATSPQGADHTAGYSNAQEILGVGGKVDPSAVEGKADLSRTMQAATAFIDAHGYCLFTAFAMLDISSGMEGMVETVNGILGTDWTVDDVGRVGMEILESEREFNAAAGFTKADDRLPEFMTYEPLPPLNEVNNIPDAVMDSVFGE